MKSHYQYKILSLIIFSLVLVKPGYADNLGRLFTSPAERIKLDKIRNAKPKPKKVEVVEIKDIIEPVKEEKKIVVRDAITLKGIVHRSDGKNTAWVNDTNTFEGDLESQFIRVPNSKISHDQATIIMPDDSTNVELKVGEVFVPDPIEE